MTSSIRFPHFLEVLLIFRNTVPRVKQSQVSSLVHIELKVSLIGVINITRSIQNFRPIILVLIFFHIKFLKDSSHDLALALFPLGILVGHFDQVLNCKTRQCFVNHYSIFKFELIHHQIRFAEIQLILLVWFQLTVNIILELAWVKFDHVLESLFDVGVQVLGCATVGWLFFARVRCKL